MRAAPSVTVTGALKCYDGTTTRDYNAISGVYVVSNIAFDWDTTSGQATGGSAMNAGNGCVLYSNSDTGGFECASEV